MFCSGTTGAQQFITQSRCSPTSSPTTSTGAKKPPESFQPQGPGLFHCKRQRRHASVSRRGVAAPHPSSHPRPQAACSPPPWRQALLPALRPAAPPTPASWPPCPAVRRARRRGTAVPTLPRPLAGVASSPTGGSGTLRDPLTEPTAANGHRRPRNGRPPWRHGAGRGERGRWWRAARLRAG